MKIELNRLFTHTGAWGTYILGMLGIYFVEGSHCVECVPITLAAKFFIWAIITGLFTVVYSIFLEEI